MTALNRGGKIGHGGRRLGSLDVWGGGDAIRRRHPHPTALTGAEFAAVIRRVRSGVDPASAAAEVLGAPRAYVTEHMEYLYPCSRAYAAAEAAAIYRGDVTASRSAHPLLVGVVYERDPMSPPDLLFCRECARMPGETHMPDCRLKEPAEVLQAAALELDDLRARRRGGTIEHAPDAETCSAVWAYVAKQVQARTGVTLVMSEEVTAALRDIADALGRLEAAARGER